MHPARPRDEQRRPQSRRVHDCRAEVRLQEDEAHRHEGETRRGEHRPPVGDAFPAIGQEGGEEEDDEELAELRGLELEGAELDPAPGVADLDADHRHEEQHRDQRAEDDLAVPAVELRVDQQRDDQADSAQQGVSGLPLDVEVGIAGDVELRDAVDRPEAVPHDRDDRGEQHPVEPAEQRRLARTRAHARRRSLRDDVIDHQSASAVCTSPASLLKNDSKTRSAAGAAASPPKPPFSITAQTTSSAACEGPYPHHQEVSKRVE